MIADRVIVVIKYCFSNALLNMTDYKKIDTHSKVKHGEAPENEDEKLKAKANFQSLPKPAREMNIPEPIDIPVQGDYSNDISAPYDSDMSLGSDAADDDSDEEGSEVMIQQSYETTSRSNSFHKHVSMGCQIATDYNTYGTLEGFVLLENGNIGCLTSASLFETKEAAEDFSRNPVTLKFLKKDVYQPDIHPNFKFGKVVKIVKDAGDNNGGDEDNIGVYAALIEINPERYPNARSFPELWHAYDAFETLFEVTKNDMTGEFLFEMAEKLGAGTGETLMGLHSLVRSKVKLVRPHTSDALIIRRQYFLRDANRFADELDSGAIVFFNSQMRIYSHQRHVVKAFGIIIGKTVRDRIIISPLFAVLKRLGLPLKLLSPREIDEYQSNKMKADIIKSVEIGISTVQTKLNENTEKTQETLSTMQTKLSENTEKTQETLSTMQTKLRENIEKTQDTLSIMQTKLSENTEKTQETLELLGKIDNTFTDMTPLTKGGDVKQTKEVENTKDKLAIDVIPKDEEGTHNHGRPTYDDLTDSSYLISFIRRHGRSSKRVKAYLQWLCDQIESAFENSAVCVWVGYRAPDPDKPVFVAELKEERTQPPKGLEKLEVLQRNLGHVDGEGECITKLELKERLHFFEKHKSVKECLTKHSKSLMEKHSNLLVVSASNIKCKRYGQETEQHVKVVCIVLYVKVKGIIPFGEEPFPQVLEDFPVDVREGTFQLFSNPDDKQHRLVMGCQIETEYNTRGTLGGFVELENDFVGGLTCCHVFETAESISDFDKDRRLGVLGDQSNFKHDVYQPNKCDDNKFGLLYKTAKSEGDTETIGVDAALIQITQRHPVSGSFPESEFPEAGFSSERPMIYDSGEIVQSFEEILLHPWTVVKYGMRTRHTKGETRCCGASVRNFSESINYWNDNAKLHQQIEIVPSPHGAPAFAQPGDSGSLVFTVSHDGDRPKLRALGLLVGGTSRGTIIVTPIWAVLKALGLPMRLMAFGGSAEGRLERRTNEGVDNPVSDIQTLKNDLQEIKSVVERNSQKTEQKLESQSSDIKAILTILSARQNINP